VEAENGEQDNSKTKTKHRKKTVKVGTSQRPRRKGKSRNMGHASNWKEIPGAQLPHSFHGVQPSRVGGGGVNRCGSCFQIT